jgi:hypothetical protein
MIGHTCVQRGRLYVKLLHVIDELLFVLLRHFEIVNIFLAMETWLIRSPHHSVVVRTYFLAALYYFIVDVSDAHHEHNIEVEHASKDPMYDVQRDVGTRMANMRAIVHSWTTGIPSMSKGVSSSRSRVERLSLPEDRSRIFGFEFLH